MLKRKRIDDEENRTVYRNVRFRDLEPGEVYKVNFKTLTFTRTSLHNRFSSRELRYTGWRPSPFSQMYIFIDLVTGEMFSIYQRITKSLLKAMTTGIVKILRDVSKPQYVKRLRAGGRDL